MALMRSVATVGGMTMISRVLGFVRDVLVAAILGAGPVADAFFVAFKFPNLFRRLFAEGAFNAAFVPIHAKLLESEGEKEARSFAEQAFSVLLWTLLVFTILVEISMPWIMPVLAPGFVGDPDRFDLAVTLTRVTFPYLLLVSLVSLMGGVLNSMGRFWAAAATPIILNLCLIGAVVLLSPLMPTPGHALAWGVFGAGVLQFVWLYSHCRRAGFWLRLPRPRLTPKVKTLLKRMVPVAIGAGIYQVNLLIDTIIASLLPTGSISYLFYADRVNQLPLGVVGVAVGTALLPLLSRQLRAGDAIAAMHNQNRALELTLLFTLPAAAALVITAEPVIRVLFGRGAFGDVEVAATAAALGVYALGLPAYVLVKALSPGFFAREDTRTPVKVAALAMVINLVLNLILMGPFLHVGIAMATVVSAWINALLLGAILMKRGHLVVDARLKSRTIRQFAACTGMVLVLLVGLWLLEPWLAGGESLRIPALAALVAGGGLSFAVLAQLSGALSIDELLRMIRRRS